MKKNRSLGASIRSSTTPTPMSCSRSLVPMWIIPRSFNDNLFQIFFNIKDCRVCTIIDGVSCNNLVSANYVTKIGLMARAHTHPYYIQWHNNSGKAKVTDTARVHFSIGTYHDSTDCDVVPMQAYSQFIGSPLGV
jgi:hypothetical protein